MLFIKSTSNTIAPHVYAVDIAAKPPGKTFDVFLAVDADNLPDALLAAIEALGFVKAFSSTYKHGDGKSVLDLHYRKIGTDIFQGWKDSEREINLTSVAGVFASFGIETKPRVMSLAEAF